MTLDLAPIALSAVAILVSVWAASKAHAAAKRQNQIQERLLALESARERDRITETKQAKLRAAITNDGRDYLLAVRNHGAGQARAVQILIDGKTPSDHEIILAQRDEVITALGPGATISLPMAITMGSPLVYDVQLSWEDDSAQLGQWHSQLNV
jgi:hypothetical protein